MHDVIRLPVYEGVKLKLEDHSLVSCQGVPMSRIRDSVNFNLGNTYKNDMVHHHKTSRHSNMDVDNCLSCYAGNSVCLTHVWQKLDLGPLTPPRSPEHDGSCESEEMDDILNGYDDMEFFSDVLIPVKELFPEGPPSPNIHSGLIQDCMWSGNNAVENSGKKPNNSTMDNYSTSQCVEPADVFPYPMAPAVNSIKDRFLTETRLHSLGTETPSDSEEEIDVCTVEQQLSTEKEESNSKGGLSLNRTIKSEQLDDNNYASSKSPSKSSVTIKVKVECPTDIHNYSLPHTHSLKRVRSMPVSPSNSPSSNKRLKRELSAPDLKRVCQKLRNSANSCGSSSNASSRSSSDSEECIGEGGKRTQHNVLERKRRNDLKYSFFHLRDSVPELNQQERAPKVLILRKAADYVNKLNNDSHRLENEKQHLKEKHDELRRTLSELQSLDF